MQHAPRLIIIISRTLRRQRREPPEPIVRARNNDLGRRDRVQQCRPIGAIVVGVSARDLGRGRLHILHAVVDRLHFGGGGGRLEPGGEVVGAGAGGGVSGACHGDGVGDGSLEGGGLGGGAGGVGDCALLDARGGGEGALVGDMISSRGLARYLGVGDGETYSTTVVWSGVTSTVSVVRSAQVESSLSAEGASSPVVNWKPWMAETLACLMPLSL